MALRGDRAQTPLESVAWRVARSSRRFFLAATLVVAVSTVAASIVAAYVAARNGREVADTQAQQLRLASSITRFRDHLSLADAELGAMLVSGRTASPLGRARYEAELLQANGWLTDARLVATGPRAADTAELEESLRRYSVLVQTSRAYPVGSTYHDLAQTEMHDRLVPVADDVREGAEAEVSGTADRLTWPTRVALGALAVALSVLLATAALVAGRTRIRLHIALVLAAVVLVGELGVVAFGLGAQQRELAEAEDAEVDAFLDANGVAVLLFDLRSAETEAVARPDDAGWEEVDGLAEAVTARLGDEQAEVADTLRPAMQAYVDSVADVEALHDQRPAEAAEATLDGGSAISHRTARGLAVSTVSRATAQLTERFEAASDASVEWPLPLGLGVASAALAAVGALRRGWDYLIGVEP